METEEGQKKLDATPASWDDVSEKANKYFKAEIDKGYKVTFKDVVLAKRAFKAGDEPKIKALCTINTLDGQAFDKVWETGSFSVMKELKKHVVENKWVGQNVVFLLKRKEADGKTTFVFEEIETIEAYA